MKIKHSNTQLSELIAKANLCLANKTTSVVKRLRYDADCGEQICSLYGLVLMIEALERWGQYGDGTPYDVNCLTLQQKSDIINAINKHCKDSCEGSSSTGTTATTGVYLEFSQENGLYILY